MAPPASEGDAAAGAGTREAAPAKVNLALHVTGRRADGYHLIDTLAVFTGLADEVAAAPADELSLVLAGPFAGALKGLDDNLVLRAARALSGAADGPTRGARLILRKELPVAAGIGGGSADAAAALRLLARLWGLDRDAAQLAALGARLGADVAMCVHSGALRARGIGELIEPVAMPPLPLVLVNPGVELGTAAVFARLERSAGAGLGAIARFAAPADVAAWLAARRNDLAAPAITLAPQIEMARAALESRAGCLIARMSGSGATVFGLFADETSAEAAAAAIARAEPGWWVRATLAC